MKKELLEEIVEKISEQTFDRMVVPQTKIIVEYQDIKFLTERVQELEEENIILKATRAGNEEHIDVLHKQNKRYREVIEGIKKTSDDYREGHLLDIQDSFFVDEIIAIINNLEGEEIE